MANEDVLIIGKLDDKDLISSIDKLVSDVADKSQEMANKFETAMNKMTSAMKDFAITQRVSVDLMKEAWKDMSASPCSRHKPRPLAVVRVAESRRMPTIPSVRWNKKSQP